MLETATRFAALLDARRFDEAAPLLAEDCRYTYYEGTYVGRMPVINIYKQLSKETSGLFTEQSTTTEIEPIDQRTFVMHGTDHLRIGDRRHHSRFDEVLTIDDGQITAIEYRMIPGEAERLHSFYLDAGLSRGE